MLAGNVVATLDDGTLTLTGDEANNSVEVTVIDGDLVVRGLEGTTINGSGSPFVAVADMTTLDGDLRAFLGMGADTLRITGPLTITGSTRLTDLSGANQIGMTDATFEGAVHLSTGNDDDAISIAEAMLRSSLTIDVGGGENVVSVYDTSVAGDVAVTSKGYSHLVHGIGHHLRDFHEGRHGWLRDRSRRSHGRRDSGFPSDLDSLWARLESLPFVQRGGSRSGQVDIVIEDSETGSFWFYTGKGSDSIVVHDSTIDGQVRGSTGAGDDFVLFDGATVTGDTRLQLGWGNDKLVTRNANAFDGDFFANGGPRRSDAKQVSDDTEFDGQSHFHRFEATTVSDAMIEMRGDGALAAAAELRTSLNGLEEDSGSSSSELPVLTLDLTMNDDTEESNGTLVTTRTMFTIVGQTTPGAAIEIAAGPSGGLDLGSTVADMDGGFSIEVMLPAGANTVMVTSMTEAGSATEMFNLHRAVGSVVRFTSSLGTFDVEMLDEDAPITVANFLSYFDEYANSFIHRAGNGTGGVPPVVQGGGFFLDGSEIKPIATTAPIANEFNASNSNLAGTLSMALSGNGFGGTDPNSGTSQWFFNIVNNTFLDANQHTVFGRIIGTGLSVLQSIQSLPKFDITASVASDPIGGFDPTDALTDVPLDGYDDFSEALPGTVSIPASSNIVTGTSTNFLSSLESGERIQINGVTYTVLGVASDTMLTLSSSPTTAVSGATVFVNPVPTADELVLFSSIDVLLPAP